MSHQIFHCPNCTFTGPEKSVKRHIAEECGGLRIAVIDRKGPSETAAIAARQILDAAKTLPEPETKTGGLVSLGPDVLPFALTEASMYAHRALVSWEALDTRRALSRAQAALGHLSVACEILRGLDDGGD